MEEQDIIEKIDKFLDKEGLDIQSKFILTKRISEEYWEDVLGEGEQNDDDLLGDLDEAEPEDPIDEVEEPEEEIAAPEDIEKVQRNELEERKQRILAKQRGQKKKITIKKPKVTTKKEETTEESSDEEEKDVLTE